MPFFQSNMSYQLFAIELSPGLEAWFTPLWLIGVGCMAGLVLVSLVWLASQALSRVNKINMLMEDGRKSLLLAAGLAFALSIIATPLILSGVSMPSSGHADDTILTMIAKYVGLYALCLFLSLIHI